MRYTTYHIHIQHKDTQHIDILYNSIKMRHSMLLVSVSIMLSCHYAECHYAECHHTEWQYAEYRYAQYRYDVINGECLGAIMLIVISSLY